MTNAEFNLLEVLMQKAGQAVSKNILSEQGLGRHFQRYDRSSDVHLSSIRRKLPPLSDGRPRIQAVLRKGYQLLTEDAGKAALVCGDAEMLHRVFDNLLRNALTHAAVGGWAGIGLTVSDDAVSVRVEDRGPGVLSSELDRLFVPFYRGTQSSGRNGHGLGLAIAHQVVDNHQGRIEAANRAEGGLCLSVVLPAAVSRASD